MEVRKMSEEINRGADGLVPTDEVEVDLDPERLENFESYDEQAPQPFEPTIGSNGGEFED